MNHQPPKTNVDVVKAFLTLQYEGRIDEAFQTYAIEDFSWVVSTQDNSELTSAIPWAGFSHKGIEGYKALTNMLFGEFEALEFEPRDFYEIADKVFVIGFFKFRHYQTEKLAESDFIGLFNMQDGRIKGGQFFENTYAVAAARIT